MYLEYTELMDKIYVWCERKREIKLTSKILFRQLEGWILYYWDGENCTDIMWQESRV